MKVSATLLLAIFLVIDLMGNPLFAQGKKAVPVGCLPA